jgi:hypothetical protein
LKQCLCLLVFALFAGALAFGQAQSDTTVKKILVNGKVFDENGQLLSNAIIINKRNKSGQFGKADGTFSISCNKTDTLAITTLGYNTREFNFKDSVFRTSYSIDIYLDIRPYKTPEVVIFAQRDLEKIQRDIASLGYNENDYMLSGIDAVSSPITFLYQQFSKKEQSKRLAAQLNNDDKKRDLLKELFHHYVAYDIIELNNEEFDAFIDYLNVSDDFLKNSSQYDFLIYVRDRFKDYKIAKRQSKELKQEDYDYNKD